MFIVDVNKNKLKHMFINILSYVSGTETVASFNILKNKNLNLLNTLYKNPWTEQCFSITIFCLKYENFFFVLPISNNTENSKIKHVVFRRLCCLLFFMLEIEFLCMPFLPQNTKNQLSYDQNFLKISRQKTYFFFEYHFDNRSVLSL